mmetsp:Transcript_95427/g.273697  ORF Transcript_95427/g.273697 Transcript_95427/m.273697 type:complete len:313 (-) Transcript_95427:39-977(-)
MSSRALAAAGGLAAGYAAWRFRGVVPEDLAGRVCLITGAGNGVGRETALQFAKVGCDLILWDLNEQGMQETIALVAKVSQARCLAQFVNVANREGVYAQAAEAQGWAAPRHVSILVNNAGIVAGKDFMSTDDDNIVKTFQVNTLAHFWSCKAFLPAMIAAKQGHVVTVASAAGLTVAPMMVPYGASKHAAVGFAHGLRKELKVLGHAAIRTSLICPAHIRTKLFEGFKQPFMPALCPVYVGARILDSVRRNRPYVVMPWMADPAIFHMLFPVSVQDRIESAIGLDSMMTNMDLGHADAIMRKVSGAGMASKL